MYTQPISTPAFPQQQGFHPSRGDNEQLVRPAQGLPTAAFIVRINSSKNQPIADRESFWHQRRAALNELRSALEAGDAEAAQEAYDALVELGQNGPLHSGATFHRTDRAEAFAAIGQALQSGDLAAAQDAFTSLADSFKRNVQFLGPPTPAPSPAEDSGGPVGPPTIAPPPPSEN